MSSSVPDGSGKSTIIDALSLVFGRTRLVRELTEHDFYGSCPEATSRIRIVATLAARGESPYVMGSTRSGSCTILLGMKWGNGGGGLGKRRCGGHGGSTKQRRASALNQVLDNAGIDAFVEAQCASCDADGLGRPRLAPGRYFRLLLGYFEGLDSERVARDIECWGSRFFAVLTHRPGRLHWCSCGGEVRASRPLARRTAGASRGHP